MGWRVCQGVRWICVCVEGVGSGEYSCSESQQVCAARLHRCPTCCLPACLPGCSVGRVGRADTLGLAISLVATLPEKVGG